MGTQNTTSQQKAWYDYPITQGYDVWERFAGGIPHTGIDLATPLDTPITSIYGGVISDVGYYSWGGSVTMRIAGSPSSAHNAPYEETIHLDAINPNLHAGSTISSGTLLGYSGGETNTSEWASHPLPQGYQHHLTDIAQSGGPHTHIGLWNGPVYGRGQAWLDWMSQAKNIVDTLNPNNMLAYARTQSVNPDNYSYLDSTGNTTNSNPLTGLLQPYIDDATKDARFIGIALVGVLIIGIGVYLING